MALNRIAEIDFEIAVIRGLQAEYMRLLRAPIPYVMSPEEYERRVREWDEAAETIHSAIEMVEAKVRSLPADVWADVDDHE